MDTSLPNLPLDTSVPALPLDVSTPGLVTTPAAPRLPDIDEDPQPAPDTRPLYQRITEKAWGVIHAYGDEDVSEVQRAIFSLQKLLPQSVRVYAQPEGTMLVYFDVAPGADLSDIPGAITLAQVAGYVEAVHPDGGATVLKDRTHDEARGFSLPMSTEVIQMADHVFGDYWADDPYPANDPRGRSEACAAFRDGKMFCQQSFEHHPRSIP